MIACLPLGTRANPLVLLNKALHRHTKCRFHRPMSGTSPSVPSCLTFNGHRANRYSHILISNSSLSASSCGFQALRQISPGIPLPRKQANYLAIKNSFGSRHTISKFLGPKWGAFSSLTGSANQVSWSQGSALIGLLLGSFFWFSKFDPVRAEAPRVKEAEAPHDLPFDHHSDGKMVYTDYSVIGIPGDGRCLFRSVAHGACLRSGKPAPSETLQRNLADELRAMVADEFSRKREETEWFIESDFDTYVSQIQKPHVWGGEPELLMLSHVLEMPITVYMRDDNSKGLISIAEYGQEYGKEDPIRVLYHGSGHYDALLFPGDKGSSRSRL